MTPLALLRIYLLRHAKSAWAQSGERDFDRPLDAEGFTEAGSIAEKAAGRGYRPARILSSTAVRCRQTAQAFHQAAGGEQEVFFSDELYNAPVEIYLELLAANDDVESLMIVGHNPTIEEALERLVGVERSADLLPIGYPTGGLAVLDRPCSHDARIWQVADFVTP